MAALWNIVRAEVQAGVDEFREKGVVGTFRDAALDTVDLAKSGVDLAKTGGTRLLESDLAKSGADLAKSGVDLAKTGGTRLLDGARELIGEEGEAILRAEGVPSRGTTCPLEFPDGRVVEAKVLDIDGVSEPARARVALPDEPEPLLVEVRPPGWERPQAEGGMAVTVMASIKQELNATVQDFREKGAVGALKDATLDAVDIVSGAACAAASGAKAVAAPLIDLDWTASAADSAEPQVFSPPPRASPPAAAGAEGAAGPSAAAASTEGAAGPSASAATAEGPPAASGAAEEAPQAEPRPPEASQAPAAQESQPPPAEVKTAPTPAPPAAPAVAQPSAEKPKAKSIVSMRRNMFEKPKQEDPKPEDEELID